MEGGGRSAAAREFEESGSPVFVSVGAFVRHVVVEQGQQRAGVEQLVAAVPQQSDRAVFSLSHILLKIEEVHTNTGQQWRHKHDCVVASAVTAHRAARQHGIIEFQPR